MAKKLQAERIEDVHVKRCRQYTDLGLLTFGTALNSNGIAADSPDAENGVSSGDIMALGVVASMIRQAGVKVTGQQAIRLAEAQGHVFVSPALRQFGAHVAADEAPVGRDTDTLGQFERPRRARVLTDRLSLYVPADTAVQVVHSELIDSFQAVIFQDSGEDLPVTQPNKELIPDKAPLFMYGYERASNWSPLSGTSHIHTARRESQDTEGMLNGLEQLYLSGHSGIPALRSLSSSPETLAVLRHTAPSGVSYTPASVAEQDSMIDDFRTFVDAIMVRNDAVFSAPDTLFIGYAAWSGTDASARASSLDTRAQKLLREILTERGIAAVPTPGIGRRAVVTRTAGNMSALIRIGDAAPRLMHTYTDRHGTKSVIAMRTGGLYSVYGAETCITDLPA